MKKVLNYLTIGFGGVIIFFSWILVKILYRCSWTWIGKNSDRGFQDMKALFLMNHTSYADHMIFVLVPINVIYKMFWNARIAVAQHQVKNFKGLLQYLENNIVPLSRQRDDSWNNYLSNANAKSIFVMYPEGTRMSPEGLDKNGKKVRVKGGVADILELLPDGDIVILYLDGFYEILGAGMKFPKLFKKVRVTAEVVDIAALKHELAYTGRHEDRYDFRVRFIEWFEKRKQEVLAR